MKILVTGSNGLVGNAIRAIDKITSNKRHSFVFATRASDGDLTKKENVDVMFARYRPDYLISTSARVGGIGGNEVAHGSFFLENLLMNAYIIDAAYKEGIKKAVLFSSVCVFPDNISVLQEDGLHDGPAYPSNFAYAYAKRMIDVQISAYEKQYGIKNYCQVIPGNIFGPHDWYSIEHGHVIPSLIHKLYLAKRDGTDFVVWGDGNSLREFLYVSDVANIVLKLLELDELPRRIIVSGDRQYSIREIVDKLVKIAKFEGNVVYDISKPNGQRSRPTDLSILNNLFPKMDRWPIDRALEVSYEFFDTNYPNVRL